jgi:hypothetical protein
MTVAWRYAVVIPAFNEAASIARVVAKVAALPGPVEVIVVDDGSTDGTAEEIARVQRDLPIASLKLAGNRGKGAAVRAGIARSPLAAARATFALNAGPNTRRFPAIVLLLIGCLPPTELHLIKAPENRGPPPDPNASRSGGKAKVQSAAR